MVGFKVLLLEILLMICGYIDGVRDVLRKNCIYLKCFIGIDYIFNVVIVVILDCCCYVIFN